MKKFEHKNKDERRRVLLSKNNVNYTLSKDRINIDYSDRLNQSDATGAAATSAVLAKVQGMNMKFIAILLALVLVATVVPVAVFMTLKGNAEESDARRLVFDSNNRLEVGPDGLSSGSYLKTIDGKDWTYNLDRDYTYGDVLTFNPSNNVITANHNPSRNSTLINVTTPINASHVVDANGIVTITLEGTETLEPNKQYYYYDGNTYYMFSFSGDTIGRINSLGDANEFDANNTDHSTRTHSVPEQNDKVKIIIDKNSGGVSYSDDSMGYDRRTIYVETDQLDEDGIYVITLAEGTREDPNSEFAEYILSYSQENSGTKKTAWTTRDSVLGITYWNDHSTNRTVFNPYASEAFSTSFEDAPVFYDVDYDLKSYPLTKYYYDSTDKSLQDIMFSGTNILPEYQAVSAEENGYWYLYGYDLTHYTEDRTLGSIYNRDYTTFDIGLSDYVEDLQYSVFLYNLYRNTAYFNVTRNSHTPNVDFTKGSIWNYDNTSNKLRNDTYHLNSVNDNAQYLGLIYPSENDEDQTLRIGRSNTGNANKLYKMEDVYTQSELPSIRGYSDQAEVRTYSPSIISYTETSTEVDGLKTKKTVTETNDPDVFNVTLEGYMTSRSLKMPTTDIVLVLDTSGRMDDVLYTRNYRNLNTQTIFEETSLSNVTHDDLFDKYNPRNSGQIDILPSRDYTDNKYIEDPNSPGTYVYLSSTYQFRSLRHYYQYSFTSSTGAVYQSPVYQRNLIGGIIGDINALTFTRQGTAHAATSIRNVTIDKFYSRAETNGTNALADQTNDSLYNYANDSSKGLFYKHTDGEYYPVTVTRSGYDSTYNYYKNYTFSVTIDNKTYTASYGNDIYGAKDSVFQGFKAYVSENGELVVDLENSLSSKSLYTRETNSNVTRLQAMKESIEDLLIHITNDARTKGAEERVAITTFSNSTAQKIPYHLGDVDMSNTRAVDAMISDIYSYTSTSTFFGLTKTRKARIDVGTASANTEFRNNSPDGNKRYEIVFTAGVPTSSNDGSLDLPVANSAIANTYTAKNTYGAEVYAVGLFPYADETHTNGDYFYYSTHPWVKCSGDVRSIWGRSTGFAIWGARDIDPIDADVTNRMLNYMSSNFPAADRTGLSTSNFYNPGGYILTIGGYGYRINRNFSRTDDKYYFGIAPSKVISVDPDAQEVEEVALTPEQLEARFREVFRAIESSIEAPMTELDPDTVMIDGITEYYDFNGDDVTDIRAYAADINTGAPINVSDPIQVNVVQNEDGKIKTIEVTKFNYSSHYLGGNSPAKLVVEFSIKRLDDFIGGNRVPTNTSDSAILDKNGHLENKFDLPAIDLYLDKSDNIAQDQSVYYGTEADLTKAFNLDDANGMNNSYVNLKYEIFNSASDETPINTYTILHGDTVGSWEHNDPADLEKMFPIITEDRTYYVKCTVDPWLDGTVSEELHPANNYPEANIYVFKPKLSATDLKIKRNADPVSIEDLISDTIEWLPDTEGVSNPTGTAPNLEYKIKTLPNGTVYDPFAKDGQGNIIPLDPLTILTNTDYQIVDLQVAPRTFNYEILDWIVEDVEVLDENDQPTGEYEHYEYWGTVERSVDRNATPLSFVSTTSGQDTIPPSAYYENVEDFNADNGIYGDGVAEPNGKYSVLVTQPFTLRVQKEFKGDYAVADDVTINVSDANDNVIATHTFSANDFTSLKTGVVELTPTTAGTSFEVGETYTITESNVDPEYYTVGFAGTDKDDATVADTVSGDQAFTFVTNKDNDDITVVLTNTWKTEKNPPITRVLSNNHYGWLIAIACFLAASGFGVYEFRLIRNIRAKKEDSAE